MVHQPRAKKEAYGAKHRKLNLNCLEDPHQETGREDLGDKLEERISESTLGLFGTKKDDLFRITTGWSPDLVVKLRDVCEERSNTESRKEGQGKKERAVKKGSVASRKGPAVRVIEKCERGQ